MAPILFYSNPAATITYVLGNDYVHVLWTANPVEAAALQAVYLQVLRALNYYQVRKTVSDHRRRPAMPLSVRKWVVQYWIPRALLEADHSHAAIITASAPIDRLITLFTPLAHRVQTRYFTSVDAGISWLRTSW